MKKHSSKIKFTNIKTNTRWYEYLPWIQVHAHSLFNYNFFKTIHWFWNILNSQGFPEFFFFSLHRPTQTVFCFIINWNFEKYKSSIALLITGPEVTFSSYFSLLIPYLSSGNKLSSFSLSPEVSDSNRIDSRYSLYYLLWLFVQWEGIRATWALRNSLPNNSAPPPTLLTLSLLLLFTSNGTYKYYLRRVMSSSMLENKKCTSKSSLNVILLLRHSSSSHLCSKIILYVTHANTLAW